MEIVTILPRTVLKIPFYCYFNRYILRITGKDVKNIQKQETGDEEDAEVKAEEKGTVRYRAIYPSGNYSGDHDDVYPVYHEWILLTDQVERNCKGCGVYRTGQFYNDIQ